MLPFWICSIKTDCSCCHSFSVCQHCFCNKCQICGHAANALNAPVHQTFSFFKWVHVHLNLHAPESLHDSDCSCSSNESQILSHICFKFFPNWSSPLAWVTTKVDFEKRVEFLTNANSKVLVSLSSQIWHLPKHIQSWAFLHFSFQRVLRVSTQISNTECFCVPCHTHAICFSARNFFIAGTQHCLILTPLSDFVNLQILCNAHIVNKTEFGLTKKKKTQAACLHFCCSSKSNEVTHCQQLQGWKMWSCCHQKVATTIVHFALWKDHKLLTSGLFALWARVTGTVLAKHSESSKKCPVMNFPCNCCCKCHVI